MIRADREQPIICDTCKKPAVRREADILNTHGGRKASYDTHDLSLHRVSHAAALERMDKFHERLHKLQYDLVAEMRKNPPKGFLVVNCDIESVRPTACEVRSLIAPTMEIRVCGLRDTVRIGRRPLKGQSIKRLARDLIRAAPPTAAALKHRFQSGEF